jgi:hypothetical protein
MRGFHARLREKPSSPFMLLGWSSVFIASLMTQSICLYFLARMLVFCISIVTSALKMETVHFS